MEYNNLSLYKDLLGNRLYIVTAVLTVVVAIGVRHIVHRLHEQNTKPVDPISTYTDGSTDTKAANVKTRQSRLLRKQFGIIEDDLQLYEEITTTIDDVATPVDLKKDEVDMPSETKPLTYETETKLDGNDDVKIIKNDVQLHETAGAETVLDNSDDANTAPTKEDEPSQQQQQTQHSLAIVSPPSSPVLVMQMKSIKRDDDKHKSQYERLQEYRRQQMLLAAESRLEQQRQFRSERNLPPLFHFWTWFDTQASLYRQYTFVRDDGIEDNTTIVPYHPSSRRSDKISIQLRITNDMDLPISVYWIDHIGKHIPKGIILSHGGTWQQTTYVDHPWIFKTKTTTDDQLDDKTERVLLHYIPHHVIPSTVDEAALDSEMESATNLVNGIHRFHIIPTVTGEPLIYNCAVRDPVLPYPASNHIFTARKAAEYALQHCIRMRYDKWMILQKYIQNIIDFPNDIQYRYIRIANPKFSDSVWNTPAKGVLLAYNFIEQSDTGYVYFGGMINTDEKDDDDNQSELPIETLQELQLLLHMIHLSERKASIEYGLQ